MSDKDLSPQSVVVPVDDDTRPFSDSLLPEAMIYAGSDALDKAQMDMANYVSGETIDWDQGMMAVAVYRAMLAAAPAPASLAGGEVMNDDAPTYMRLAQALSRHPEVMVVERSDPTLELTPDSLEHLLEDVFPLAALSPEAPAREGSRIAELEFELSAKTHTLAIADEQIERLEARIKALTPRHEAPARGVLARTIQRAIGEAWVGEHQAEVAADAVLALSREKAPASALDNLVDRFAAALKEKLHASEAKYGHNDAWMRDDWLDDLIEQLGEHVQKGDPRDVAAYCAFAWHHGWSLTPRHEVPAEGAGDGHMSDCAIHNAPALPVGPCDCGSPFLTPEDIKRALELRADPDSEDNERFASWYGDTLLEVHQLAIRLDAALRARSSAPEARDEALGNLLAVIHGDGGHRALEVGVEQAAAEAEKIVARLLSSAPEAREREAVAVTAKDMAQMTCFANNHGTLEDWAVWCRIRSALTTHPAAPSAEKLRDCEGCGAPPLYVHDDDCPVMAANLAALKAEV